MSLMNQDFLAKRFYYNSNEKNCRMFFKGILVHLSDEANIIQFLINKTLITFLSTDCHGTIQTLFIFKYIIKNISVIESFIFLFVLYFTNDLTSYY